MNEELKTKLKVEIIETLKTKGYDYKPFEIIIDIYTDMKVQELIFEERLNNYNGNSEGEEILINTIEILKDDISSYEELLLLEKVRI